MKKVLATILSLIALSLFAAERPIVKVDTGSLQGAVEYNMQVFKNIPYAAPPGGRFEMASPAAGTILGWNA